MNTIAKDRESLEALMHAVSFILTDNYCARKVY